MTVLRRRVGSAAMRARARPWPSPCEYVFHRYARCPCSAQCDPSCHDPLPTQREAHRVLVRVHRIRESLDAAEALSEASQRCSHVRLLSEREVRRATRLVLGSGARPSLALGENRHAGKRGAEAASKPRPADFKRGHYRPTSHTRPRSLSCLPARGTARPCPNAPASVGSETCGR